MGQLYSIFTFGSKINVRAFSCESKTVFIAAVQTNDTNKIIEDNHSESEYVVDYSAKVVLNFYILINKT